MLLFDGLIRNFYQHRYDWFIKTSSLQVFFEGRMNRRRHFLVFRILMLKKAAFSGLGVYASSSYTFAPPFDTFHVGRSPDIWGLPPLWLERRKGRKKKLFWFQVILLLVGLWQLGCSQGWADLHPRPLSVRISLVPLSTFRVWLASSVQRDEMWIMKGAFSEQRLGFPRDGTRERNSAAFWNDWLQHNENAQENKDDGASFHITCPVLSAIQVYDNRTIVSHKYLLSSPYWDLLHHVSVLFCFFVCQELPLPMCDLLICESCQAQSTNWDSWELRHVHGTMGSLKNEDLWYEVWRSTNCNSGCVVIGSCLWLLFTSFKALNRAAAATTCKHIIPLPLGPKLPS